MAEKKAKTEEVVENKPTSRDIFVANQLRVLNMQNTAKAQRNIERVLRKNRKEKK